MGHHQRLVGGFQFAKLNAREIEKPDAGAEVLRRTADAQLVALKSGSTIEVNSATS